MHAGRFLHCSRVAVDALTNAAKRSNYDFYEKFTILLWRDFPYKEKEPEFEQKGEEKWLKTG